MKAFPIALVAAALFLNTGVARAQRVMPAGVVNRVEAVPQQRPEPREMCVTRHVIEHSLRAGLYAFLSVAFLSAGDPDKRNLPWIALGAGALAGGAYGVYKARRNCDLESFR
jgi:hypothetical protein